MTSWIDLLKKHKHAKTDATKATKAPQKQETPPFVAFVASTLEDSGKNDRMPPPPTQRAATPPFVAFVASPDSAFQKTTPPLPDPGMVVLLALADRFCDATQASDKAKAAWPADIESTPPELRGDLAAYLREQLAAMPKQASTVKAAPMPPPTTPPPKPMPRFSVHAPWNEADNAYQNHHWNCEQCRVNARTRDREPRCATGQELYAAYELAAY